MLYACCMPPGCPCTTGVFLQQGRGYRYPAGHSQHWHTRNVAVSRSRLWVSVTRTDVHVPLRATVQASTIASAGGQEQGLSLPPLDGSAQALLVGAKQHGGRSASVVARGIPPVWRRLSTRSCHSAQCAPHGRRGHLDAGGNCMPARHVAVPQPHLTRVLLNL